MTWNVSMKLKRFKTDICYSKQSAVCAFFSYKGQKRNVWIPSQALFLYQTSFYLVGIPCIEDCKMDIFIHMTPAIPNSQYH
jgi:hypothetical protein